MEINQITSIIIEEAIYIHKELGPGLLESVYVFALRKELELRNITADPEVRIKLFYKGYDTGKYYNIDLLVNNEIIIEAKSIDEVHPIHEAQIISHLKLTEKRLGYLVNFNVIRLKEGFKRFVNKF